jgi:hypothetical protein
MEFYAIQKNGILKPAYPEDSEKAHKMRSGEVYRVRVSMPRNVKFHRKFFTLINLVFDNLPEEIPARMPDGEPIQIRSRKDLLWHIKMQIGHYEQKVTLGGRVTYEAKSISFAAMDEAEFEEFYNAAIDVILKYFLPETNREELTEIIALTY